LPLIDGIVYDIVQESQPLWLLFLQGKIDAAGIPKDFFFQAVTQERTLTPFLRDKGINLIVQEDPDTYWIGFNMEDPVVGKNLPLRRAMSMAYNRKEYIDIFTNGRGIPAKGIFPPMFKEFDKDFKNPWSEFNLDGAKKLMKEAEKINGGPITVTLSMPGADTTSRQSGQHFKRAMSKIGLNASFGPSMSPNTRRTSVRASPSLEIVKSLR
jgi:ABC-type transport system substrate-binding protein